MRSQGLALTLAHGLSDSPSGLRAWIVENYRAWSDRGGELSAARGGADRHRGIPSRSDPTPHSWMERTYQLTRYTVMPRRGHFAAQRSRS